MMMQVTAASFVALWRRKAFYVQELTHANQMQQEAIRMLMSAVNDCSKGKDSQITDLGRSPLFALHLMGSETHQNALVEENAQLKAELEELRKKNKKQTDQVSSSAMYTLVF